MKTLSVLVWKEGLILKRIEMYAFSNEIEVVCIRAGLRKSSSIVP